MSVLHGAAERLRNCHAALSRAVTPAERTAVLRQIRQVAELLEESGRVRLRSDALAARVAQLEQQLSELASGARRDAICKELAISRSYFYELRARVHKVSDCTAAP